MKITFEQAQAILYSGIFTAKLPVAAGFKFARLGKQLVGEMETFNTSRMKLIEDCGGVLNEEKQNFTFSPENETRFVEGFKSLLLAEIEVGDAFPISVADLGDASFSPNDLAPIEPILALP